MEALLFWCGISVGVTVGALPVWFLMDRRLNQERRARDNAVDAMARMSARTPVTVYGVADDERARKEVEAEAEEIRKQSEQIWADEVGEEPRTADSRSPAGVDMGAE